MAATVTGNSGTTNIPQCCCGSTDCAFLAHNGKLLEGLERDVSKAAQLGQALLIRHETYVADSERERKQMLKAIEDLEKEKLQLEEKNAQTIKANRDLLDELERLNDAVAASDAHVQALTETLHSTEEELQRLSALATRTQLLERQLIDLEMEQSQIQHSLESKTADERTAMQRWKRAEQTIANLQDQIDRIEKEAREEKDRHVEVVARMERRMVLEGELATTAGKFKARAGHEKGSSSVVTHFVKDILLDNANLQNGIVELREMLLNSIEEVERLRDQLRVHQPVVTPPAAGQNVETRTLQNELGPESIYNQELHIHHHYHGQAPPKSNPRPKAQRRPRNKRFSATPSYFTPIQADPGSQATIISQTAATVPNTNRWSNATTLAPSLPGSPLSASHRDSIYDRVFSDVPYDSSRPTSPSDSIDLQSPLSSEMFAQSSAFHKRKKSHSLRPPTLSTIRSASTPVSITAKSSPASAVISAVSPANSLANDAFALSPSITPSQTAVIPEEIDENSLTSPRPDPQSTTSQENEEERPHDLASPIHIPRSNLRRVASHESLISISGMDIHTLRSRPSQLLLSTSPRFATPGGAGSIQPELTPWTATATTGMSRSKLDSSAFNRTLLHSSLASSSKRTTSGASALSSDDTQRNRLPSAGMATKIGGWVFGKWGASPTPTTTVTADDHNPNKNNHNNIAPKRQTATPPPTSTTNTPTPTVRITRQPYLFPTSHSRTHSSSPLRPESSTSAQTHSSASTNLSSDPTQPTITPATAASAKKKEKEKEKFKLRPAGVNQSGPIWGFFDIPETPTKVEVGEGEVDADALGEALAE